MIRTISFMEGGSDLAGAVQDHAFALARHVGARLHAVVAWDPEDAERLTLAGDDEDPEDLTEAEVSESIGRAEKEGIDCEATFHGEGVVEGLLSEARQSDLLVVGLPTEESEPDSPQMHALVEDGIQLLRRAESSLLVVCKPFSEPTHLLIVCQEGIESKCALRLGGYVAETFGARVTVAAFAPRLIDATILASLAENYLKGFALPQVEVLLQDGEAAEAADIGEMVRRVKADYIVFGAEPYGMLEGFFGHRTAERLVLRIRVPVLIAR